MSDSFQRFLTMLKSAYGQHDILVDEGQTDLRLNLLPETIDLWGATYSQADNTDNNLLLACSSSSGPIEDTTLTWVVGSAIRHVHVSSEDECWQLFHALGLRPNLADAIVRHCPGIANGAIWALYNERHGHLVATPVVSAGLGREAMARFSSISS